MPFIRIQNITGSDLVVDSEIPVIPKHSVVTTQDFPTSALERLQAVLTHLRTSRKIEYIVYDQPDSDIDPELELATYQNVTDASGGGGGGTVTAYVHTQNFASALWIVNHNLGHYPTVEVVDSMSRKVSVEVTHFSPNQARVTATVAFTGFARCV